MRDSELALPPDAAPGLLAAARARPQPPGAKPTVTLVPAAVTDPAGGVWACEWAHDAATGVHGIVGEAWAGFVRAWGGGGSGSGGGGGGSGQDGSAQAKPGPSLVVVEGRGLPWDRTAAPFGPVVGLTAAIVDADSGAHRVPPPPPPGAPGDSLAALFCARADAALAGAAAALAAEAGAALRG